VNAIIHSKYNDKHRDVILQNENTEQSFVFLTALFSSTFPANLAASLDLKPSIVGFRLNFRCICENPPVDHRFIEMWIADAFAIIQLRLFRQVDSAKFHLPKRWISGFLSE